MRLIDCSTLTLHSVEISQAPHYAALSHTWTDDEALFEDMPDPSIRETRKGWSKIEMTCQKALRDGLEFAWVDTCCIDKSSSAELSENINSMFKIYAQAWVCYAYLADFKVPTGLRRGPRQPLPDITGCRWFKRGWTLQELIAPKNLQFFDQNWTFIGSRHELSDQISRRTNIPQNVLNGESIFLIRLLLDSCTIAMKMSWAADRTTARPEDMAYSLLGIFDINMPMLYGEGNHAFSRLQEELIKESNDMSIFAWQTSRGFPLRATSTVGMIRRLPAGILAREPGDFANGHKLVPSPYHEAMAEFSMTNKGLRIEATLMEIASNLFFMPLHHTWGPPTDGSSTTRESVGVGLERRADGTYERSVPESLLVTSHERFDAERQHTTARFIRGQFHIVKDTTRGWSNMINPTRERLRISTGVIDAGVLRVVAREPRSQWDAAAELFVMKRLVGLGRFVAYQHMVYTNKAGLACDLLLVCGMEVESTTPWACLMSIKENPTLYNATMLEDMEATYNLARQSGSESVSPDGMAGLCASARGQPVYEGIYVIHEVTLRYQW